MKRALGFLLLLVALALPGGAEDPKARAQALVREGDRLQLQAGQATDEETAQAGYRQAMAKFSEAIQVWPECFQAYLNRSTIEYFQGDSETARADARKALAIGGLPARDYYFVSAPFQGEEARQILRTGMALARPDSFDYSELVRALIQTYWYDGDFKTYVSELEKRVALQRPGRPSSDTMFDAIELNLLAMGYDALGDFARAEGCYRRGLALPAPASMPFNQSAMGIVTTRMHANDLEGARAAVTELAGQLGPDFHDIYQGVLAALSGQPVPEAAQLRKRASLGRPGSLFFEGVLDWAAGDESSARTRLTAFCKACAENPTEWGITQRWEVARAQEILSRLSPPDGRS